jgi:uncharacterized protein (TIGR02996 family)
MTEEEALIAGIHANPLDDLPRLVYADWLDERNRFVEGEYLRLVAALAKPGTPVDMRQPHSVRVVAIAEGIDPQWREATGSRFDLWIDPPLNPARIINFIKTAREVSGLGLAELKAFCHTLPKVLTGGLPLEEAIGQVQVLCQSAPLCRILPTTKMPQLGLLRRDISLQWQAGFRSGRHVTTAEQTRAALAHLRRILAINPETAPMADAVPETTEEFEWAVTLAKAQPASEIARWRERLCSGDYLHGATASPPFSGSIGVRAV